MWVTPTDKKEQKAITGGGRKRSGHKPRNNGMNSIISDTTILPLSPIVPAIDLPALPKKPARKKKSNPPVTAKRATTTKPKEMTPAKKRKFEMKQRLLQDEQEAKAKQAQVALKEQVDPMQAIQQELLTLERERTTLVRREDIRRRLEIDKRMQELESMKTTVTIRQPDETAEMTPEQIQLKRYYENLAQPAEFIDQDVCMNPQCSFYKTQKLILKVDEGKVVCPKCTHLRDYLPSTSTSLPFGEDIELVSHVYHRPKHFRLFLNQYRAGILEVPDHVIRKVREDFSKIHVMTVSEIKSTKVREILKARGLGEWTEYSNRIASRLNGTPIPEFTDRQIGILQHMYLMVQEPFAHLKEPTRDNFMNTTYLMRQFCEIMGWTEVKKCFPNPKSPDVCKEQDLMMKRVCAYVGWPFSRSF